MTVHRPTEPGWLHVTQAPAQAALQQTPSVQNPEAHRSLLVHLAPLGLNPQLWFTHCWLAAHWEFVVHSKAQAPVSASHV